MVSINELKLVNRAILLFYSIILFVFLSFIFKPFSILASISFFAYFIYCFTAFKRKTENEQIFDLYSKVSAKSKKFIIIFISSLIIQFLIISITSFIYNGSITLQTENVNLVLMYMFLGMIYFIFLFSCVIYFLISTFRILVNFKKIILT